MVVVKLTNSAGVAFFVGREEGELVPQSALPDAVRRLKKYHTVSEARADTTHYLGEFRDRECVPYYGDLNKPAPSRLF